MTNAKYKLMTASLLGASMLLFAQDRGGSIKVTGWVLDSACAYTKGLDKPIGVACAKECAKNGSPLVILRDDGTIFIPIDGATPSHLQNPRLMPFAGEHVTVVGKDYVRNGSHGLVIDTIVKQASGKS